MFSYAEENYIKVIYHLSNQIGGEMGVSTNAIAEALQTKAASVTDMLRKLAAKDLINYVKYQGVSLTPSGKTLALQIVRKHRLWEVFLVQKLNFQWDEVHEIAEQLEHIKSALLIERLDAFLGHPTHDPHGDPIPTQSGEIQSQPKVQLSGLPLYMHGIVIGVKESTPPFLQYLDKAGIYIGAQLRVIDKADFDNSVEVQIDNAKTLRVSNEVAQNIYISA